MSGQSGEIPCLSEILEPSDFVFAYKDLDVSNYIGRLAPSLGLVIRDKLYSPVGSVAREFTDCEIFIGITDLNQPFLEALKAVNKALSNPQGTITLPLTQEMGFGKTHFETLLFHLYTEVPKRWKSLMQRVELEDRMEKLVQEGAYKPVVADETIVFPIDLKTLPDSLDPYTALFENCARLIRKYKVSVDEKIFEKIKDLSRMEPKRAAADLAKIIKMSGVTTRVLIILDELYACAFETASGGDAEQIRSLNNLMLFLTSFVDELKESHPVVVVYASAQQDINRWREVSEQIKKLRQEAILLIETIGHFEDRTSRVQIPMKQMVDEDVINLVKRRLLRPKAPTQEVVENVGRTCMDIIKNYSGESASLRYYDELLKTYPFAPTYRFFVNKLMTPTIGGDLPRTQHLRDLLRITASLIAKVYENDICKKVSLISLSYLSHDDVKHLLDEKQSMEWGRLYGSCKSSVNEIRDEKIRFLAERMLSVIYIKSLTTNVSKILNMIRSPEVLSREEILLRGTSVEDLVFSLVGGVPHELLPSFYDAYSFISRSTPYVMDIEHSGKKYLVLSFVFNPTELIESMKREEMAQYRNPDGTLDPKKLLDYFRRQLETEYSITGQFAKESGKAERPALVLINYDAFVKGGNGADFVNWLDKDRFTILVLTPWSVAERTLTGKTEKDCIAEIKEAVRKSKHVVNNLNMFAVIVPEVNMKTLEHLSDRVAEVLAAKRVVNLMKVKEAGDEKSRKLELARKAQTYSTLSELLKGEEKFEDIVLDIMNSLQERIEEYAKQYTNTAVQNYTSEFINCFKHIIYYDAGKGEFIEDKLDVEYHPKDDFEKVYAELPAWLTNSVIKKCAIDEKNSILAKLIKHIIEPRVIERKGDMEKGMEIMIDTEPLIEAAMRGWRSLPIRPLSRRSFEDALSTHELKETRLIAGINIKVSYKPESKQIILQPVVKPPPPPQPPSGVNNLEIWEIGNVINAMQLLERDEFKDKIEKIEITVETTDGCVLNIAKASLEDLDWAIGVPPTKSFISRVSKISPEIKIARLHIKFLTPFEFEHIRKVIVSLGVSEGNFNIR